MQNNQSLSGKVALVTGSGRNIGKATALHLASLGAAVAVNARTNESEAKSVEKEIIANGGQALSVLGDVGSENEVKSMFEKIESTLGNVTILVNNAGLREDKFTSEMTTEEWRRVLSVNLDGPFYCSRAAIPGMIEADWGRIVNVSGLNSFKGKEGWGHVCASKMGAIGLTRALSIELATNNICLLYTSPSPRDVEESRMPSSA